jgi:2,3-dihydroxybenzoate-AMP ligase
MLDGVVPYPADLAARYRRKGYWQDRPLISHFLEAFDKHAERVAMTADGADVTYHELGQKVDRLARHLLGAGFKPLDRVVMQLPNIPEFVYLYFALQRLGAIPLLALPPHREREIGYYVQFIEAAGYAIPGANPGGFDFCELARSVQRSSSSLQHVIVAGPDAPDGFLSLGGCLETEPSVPASSLDALSIDPTDPCCFQLSGGTTGIPKVIPRSHNDYVYNSIASGAVNDIRDSDALLVVLPIAHNFPLASPGIQAFLLAGARIVLSASTRAAQVLPLIRSEGVTHLEIVPAMMIRWLDDPGIGSHDFPSVRVINSGGQKFQSATKLRAEQAFSRAKVQEVFGMAEGLLTFSRLDDPDQVRIETVGRPVCPDDEVILLDEESEHEVPVGEIGELCVRGPYTLRGYFRSPEYNARAFTADGFYKSGDLLRKTPEGNYVVEGRKKDVINRGGEKISAEEVENLILMHPAVHNVACVPMPDRVLGEKMCAFVIARPGQTITLAELSAYLTDMQLARYKHPERVELVTEFPISNFGKVQKNILSARVAEILQVP